MINYTPLYNQHLAANAKMVDFAGWKMPLHYGSQIEEHQRVRNFVGMFDVSHMAIVDLKGLRVREFLKYLLANDVGKLTITGKAFYSCMLNHNGGVLDDLIVYYLQDDWFRLVVNASTRNKDLTWIQQQAAPYNINVIERCDLAMLAVQGPATMQVMLKTLQNFPQELKYFQGTHFKVDNNEWFIARTGYTGEDGFEIMLPNEQASQLWDNLLNAGVVPCGLGARDTLRLEAGMNLYGNDMDESVTPLESGLSWTVAFNPKERNFIGRIALEQQLQYGISQKLVGLLLNSRAIMRHGQIAKIPKIGSGIITSGGFAPTLQKSIALARIPSATNNNECLVEIRGQWLSAQIVKIPFVRFGKKVLID